MKKTFLFLSIFISLFASAQFRSIESVDFGDVSVIELGANGNVWVGSATNGCAAFIAASQSWSNFTTLNSSMKSDSITAITLYSIGGVAHSFMGTTNGVGYKHGAAWDTLAGLINSHVIDIVRSPTNHCLYVATEGGISIFNDTTLVHIGDYTTGNTFLPWGAITCFQSKQTNISGFYYGTPDTGMYISNNGTNWAHTSMDAGGIVDDRINCIYIDATGANQYYGTKGGFTYYNGSVNNYTTANGLHQNDVTAIDIDCNLKAWVGTRDSGIAVFDYTNTSWQYITTAQGLPSNRITSINCSAITCQTYIGTADAGAVIIDSLLSVAQLPTDVTNLQQQFMVKLSPQPANDVLNFVLENEIKEGEISIFDISGKMVSFEKIITASQFSINTKNLEQGFYFYSIRNQKSLLNTGKISILR